MPWEGRKPGWLTRPLSLLGKQGGRAGQAQMGTKAPRKKAGRAASAFERRGWSRPPLGHSPLGHIATGDGLGRDFPGAIDAPAWQPLEVKLAADFRVRPTSVGHIVTVERHHVAEEVCAGIRIWGRGQIRGDSRSHLPKQPPQIPHGPKQPSRVTWGGSTSWPLGREAGSVVWGGGQ